MKKFALEDRFIFNLCAIFYFNIYKSIFILNKSIDCKWNQHSKVQSLEALVLISQSSGYWIIIETSKYGCYVPESRIVTEKSQAVYTRQVLTNSEKNKWRSRAKAISTEFIIWITSNNEYGKKNLK